MSFNYGVLDLAKHIVFLNEKEGNDELHRASLGTLIFVSLGLSYKHGFDFKYDIMFEKRNYGSFSNDLRDELGVGYNVSIEHNQGQVIPVLMNDAELISSFIKLINKVQKDFFALVSFVINQDLYIKDKEYIKEVAERGSMFSKFPLWTKREITLIFDPENKTEIDSRIPLNEYEHNAMMKYHNLSILHNEDTLEFNKNELIALKNMPDHLIESVYVNGSYVKEEELN